MEVVEVYFKFSAANLFLAVFQVVTSCGLVAGYQRFGETYCLDLQGITTQKTTMVTEEIIKAFA
jgi:hypothetical protein